MRARYFLAGWACGTAGLVAAIFIASSVAYERRYPRPQVRADQHNGLRAVPR